MERKIHITLTLIFLIIISLPILDTVLGILPNNKNTENRILATFSFDSVNYLDWPKAYEKYFQDRFHGRSTLFDLNMKLKRELSSKPFKGNSVLVGKDGWYFSNFQKVVDDYRAVRPFTESELQQIKNSLLTAKQQLNEMGINYYLMIVPNKHTVYSDELPDYIKKIGKKSRFEQLLPVLRAANINVIDIRLEMDSVHKKQNLYFKTDSHWNLNGSFVGYFQLLKRINKDYPDIKPYEKNEFTIENSEKSGGDIVAMMGQSESIRDSTVNYKPKFKVKYEEDSIGPYKQPIPKIFHPEQTVSAFKNEAQTKTAVVFTDSYAGYMHPFLNLHFKRIVYVWGHDYNLNKPIVIAEKPDMVIQVIVERYLFTLLEASEVSAN